jgi:hypothetical protein
MASLLNEQKMPKSCGSTGFNYCKWAKTLVAIPALPIIAFIAASFFQNPVLQLIAAFGAIAAAIYGAIWLDRVPLLTKKMRRIKGDGMN